LDWYYYCPSARLPVLNISNTGTGMFRLQVTHPDGSIHSKDEGLIMGGIGAAGTNQAYQIEINTGSTILSSALCRDFPSNVFLL